MTMTAWLLLAAIAIGDATCHLMLKAATDRAETGSHGGFLQKLTRDLLFWFAIGSFVALLLVWVAFYSLVPLSQGVMASTITIVAVLLGGRIFFHERITPPRAIAVILIGLGVLLVGWDAA